MSVGEVHLQPDYAFAGHVGDTHHGLPVAGYRPQTASNVDLVNRNKGIEERVLRILDELAANPNVDPAWLYDGRRMIERGFMCVNRAVFKPARVELPEFTG